VGAEGRNDPSLVCTYNIIKEKEKIFFCNKDKTQPMRALISQL
jgi:hypothetical protein